MPRENWPRYLRSVYGLELNYINGKDFSTLERGKLSSNKIATTLKWKYKVSLKINSFHWSW